jgi:RNA polymerase sigma factor (sigma-70 family)
VTRSLQQWLEEIQQTLWAPTIDTEALDALQNQVRASGFLAQVLVELPDEDLTLALRHDFCFDEAFVELCDTRYSEKLARWCFRWGVPSQDAGDFIADLSVKFLENGFGGYDPAVSPFAAYLYRSAFHLSVDKHRKRRPLVSLPPDVESVTHGQPSDDIEAKEFAAMLEQALASLPQPQQEIFRRIQDEQSPAAIAKELKLNRSTVFNALHRGRRVLEEMLRLPSQKRSYNKKSNGGSRA